MERKKVTVKFFCEKMYADVDAWVYDSLADEMNMECWTPVKVSIVSAGKIDMSALNLYVLSIVGGGEHTVKGNFEIFVNAKDIPLSDKEQIALLREALNEVKSDLWLQIQSKHGPEAAYNYPSLKMAAEALKRTN